MNVPSALESYLVFGVYLLPLPFIALLVFRIIKASKKRKKLIKDQAAVVSKLQHELINWQSLSDLTKKIVYSRDLERSLDLLAEYLVKAFDASSVSYLIDSDQGYSFRARLCGNVSKGYLAKSKEFLTKAFIGALGLQESSVLSEDHINGGEVLVAEGFDPGNGVSDFLKQVVVNISFEGSVIGVLGVFGSSDILGEQDAAQLATKSVNLCTSFTEEYTNVLSKELRKLESVLQSMNEGVLLFDYDYKVSIINKTTSIFLNCEENTPADIGDVSQLLQGALPIQEVVSNVMDSGEPKLVKRVFVNNRYLSFTFMPVNFSQEIVGVGVVIHNDSEEEKLKDLREDFTAMVVHELRAPLTVIRGSADMILQNKGNFSQDDINLFLDQIKNSSWDLLKLVSDLLDSAKMESGKFTVNKASCVLNHVIEEEIENYKTFTESKNIDLVTDLSSDIPEVQADKEKITQVLTNLLSNAVKFTYKGEITHMGERGFIKVGSRLQDGFVQIFVADNGPGIPDDVKKQLFNKFVQARESQVSNESGTGLGLAIAKGIVEAHGGKIWVEDNVPQGSVFIFTLPIE
jgi:signal transduction histidine kinase